MLRSNFKSTEAHKCHHEIEYTYTKRFWAIFEAFLRKTWQRSSLQLDLTSEEGFLIKKDSFFIVKIERISC